MQPLTVERQHPPHEIIESHQLVVTPRKVTALDRIAVRIGLALILWSRRHVARIAERDRQSAQYALLVANEQREQEARSRAHLTFPVR